MSCYHPMKGFKYGQTNNGKDNFIITNYDIDHIEIDGKGNIIRCFDHDSNPAYEVIRGFTEIPCGKCIGCRLDNARRFSDRIFLELRQHKENCFITLTYDDDHLEFNKRPTKVDPETGEILEFDLAATLRKDHMSKFMKSFRNYLNFKEYKKDKNGKSVPVYYKKGDPEFKEIKFFGCGEYGSLTSRPHMHIIIFGWSPIQNDPDLCYIGKNDLNQPYYSSKIIEYLWKKGNNIVSDASYNTGAYVARYCQKKAFGKDKSFFESNFIEPEFVNMSRRPGIGYSWFDSHKTCYATFSVQDFDTDTGSVRIYGNRYFDRLMEKEDDNPDLNVPDVDYRKSMFERKEERRYFQENKKKIKYAETSKSYKDALLDEEAALIARTKVLTREKI